MSGTSETERARVVEVVGAACLSLLMGPLMFRYSFDRWGGFNRRAFVVACVGTLTWGVALNEVFHFV